MIKVVILIIGIYGPLRRLIGECYSIALKRLGWDLKVYLNLCILTNYKGLSSAAL